MIGKKKVILVDMDGVLADFESGFLQKYTEKFPTREYISLENRSTFYVTDNYGIRLRRDVESVYNTPLFFQNLPPIAGGREALEAMTALGYDVLICTTPLHKYDNCVVEKYNWVKVNLGEEWTRKIVMTHDKTLVYGDYLIDDKPFPVGLQLPSWEHVLYDAPYNRNIQEKRRLTWENWQSVIEAVATTNAVEPVLSALN